jgi:hypothetical protein
MNYYKKALKKERREFFKEEVEVRTRTRNRSKRHEEFDRTKKLKEEIVQKVKARVYERKHKAGTSVQNKDQERVLGL